MLTDFTGGQRHFEVDAQTLEGALRAAEKTYPLLRVHLFDEKGDLRQHVQVFFNSTDCRELPSLDVPAKDGDEIIVLQAISGGAGFRRYSALLAPNVRKTGPHYALLAPNVRIQSGMPRPG